MRDPRLRRWAPLGLCLLAFVALSVAVVPRMRADSSARVVTHELGAGQPVTDLRQVRAGSTVDGYAAPGFARASVSFAAAAPELREGDRTFLLVSGATRPGVDTRLSVVDADRTTHRLGLVEPGRVNRIEVTEIARSGLQRIELSAANHTVEPLLFADRVAIAAYSREATPRAGRGEVAAWVLLAVLLGVVALRRPRSDLLLLPAVTALTAFLAWPDVKSSTIEPLFSELWGPAVGAEWIDLHEGLLSGTFDHHSSLAVQLLHALTPLTGSGTVGARTGTMLLGVAAVVAIYVLGRRVAGALGATAAVACALLTDSFRLSMTSGDATTALVLAATLFLVAAHRVLQGADRAAMGWLGAAGALAILAEPTWWPGVVAAIALLALRCAPRGARARVFGAALLVLAIVSLPSRLSVADQSGGDVNGDVVERSTRARNAEFVGRGHGAPETEAERLAEPAAGPEVGLFEYVLGDHSPSVVVGGTMTGAYDGLEAAGDRPDTKLPGLVAFVFQLVGLAYLLLIPRLRRLVAVAALVAAVPWFFVSRDVVPVFAAASAFWPVLPAGAAVLAYALREAVRRRS